MKTKVAITIILVACFDFTFSQENLTKQNKKELEYQEVVKIVQSGSFIFEANKMFQQGGGMIDLTTNLGYLKINEKRVEADLPFFGETYLVHDISGDAGINFEGEMLEYKEVQNDEKMRVEIKFQVKTVNDKYSCMMDLFSNGKASLDINCISKSHARYRGNIKSIKDK